MDTMISTYGLYAYGLAGTNLVRPDLWGIDKMHAVYSVERQGLCVLVSEINVDEFQRQVQALMAEVSKTLDATQSRAQALLQAHEDVVDTLMSDTTIVPFRFGTILKDEQAASKMLQDHEEKFKNLLTKFTGKVEWGLKIYADEQAFIKHIQNSSQRKQIEEQRAKLSRGVAYLLAKKLEADSKDNAATQLTRITEYIFQELGRDAYDTKLDKTLPRSLTHKKEEMILNSAYLVERAQVEKFWQKGNSLKEKYASIGLELEISGPWPPYSFIE